MEILVRIGIVTTCTSNPFPASTFILLYHHTAVNNSTLTIPHQKHHNRWVDLVLGPPSSHCQALSAVAGGELSVPHYCNNISGPHLAQQLKVAGLTPSMPQKHCYKAELEVAGLGLGKPSDKLGQREWERHWFLTRLEEEQNKPLEFKSIVVCKRKIWEIFNTWFIRAK